MTALLDIQNLNVAFTREDGKTNRAVRDLSLSMGREKLGIVGESGSGKSLTARAVLGIQSSLAHVQAAKMQFDGIDLTNASKRQLRGLRGDRIGMIMQDPRHSLNPVHRIGDQIIESVRLGAASNGKRLTKRAAMDIARTMLDAVDIRDADRVMRLYPHEVSGGMGQRVMIAIAFVREPDLLIADEITSALDVTVQARVLEVLDEMVSRRDMGLIFISHDLPLVSRFCDRVLVMYAGRVVEEITASDLENAKHPYTQGLLRCMPKIDGTQAPLPVLERDPSWLEPVQ